MCFEQGDEGKSAHLVGVVTAFILAVSIFPSSTKRPDALPRGLGGRRAGLEGIRSPRATEGRRCRGVGQMQGT